MHSVDYTKSLPKLAPTMPDVGSSLTASNGAHIDPILNRNFNERSLNEPIVSRSGADRDTDYAAKAYYPGNYINDVHPAMNFFKTVEKICACSRSQAVRY